MRASIIIPAYNAAKTIAECIESLMSQSVRPHEIIIVDDGSSDNTIELAKGFKGVMVLKQKHAGPAAARNLGAEKSTGEIVVFLDSDCVPTKNWLKEMLEPFSEKDVVGVQGRYLTKQKKLISRFIQLEIEERYEKMACQKYIDFIGSYAAAYKKSVFEEMNGFDISFPMASGEDTDLSFRINEKGYKMVFNPNATLFHTHPESLKKYLKVKFFRALWRMKIYKKHKRKMVKDAYTSQTVKLQTALFYAIAGLVILEPLFKGSISIAATFSLLLLITTIPFSVWAFARDPLVGLVSPAVIILRTIMFGFGMVFGILNHLRRSF